MSFSYFSPHICNWHAMIFSECGSEHAKNCEVYLGIFTHSIITTHHSRLHYYCWQSLILQQPYFDARFAMAIGRGKSRTLCLNMSVIMTFVLCWWSSWLLLLSQILTVGVYRNVSIVHANGWISVIVRLKKRTTGAISCLRSG
jgi:hypothetical protein